MSSPITDAQPISDADTSTNSSIGKLTKKPSFASMAAKGTSITVSELKAEVSLQQTSNDNTLDLSTVFQEARDCKSPTPAAASAAALKASSKPQSHSRRSISSSATVSTDSSSTTSVASTPSLLLSTPSLSTNDEPPVNNVPKPAPVSPKNPWKVQTTDQTLSQSTSSPAITALSSTSTHAPTPAESKDMRPKPKLKQHSPSPPAQQKNGKEETSISTVNKTKTPTDKQSNKSAATPSTCTNPIRKNQGGSAWKTIDSGDSKDAEPSPLLEEVEDGNNNINSEQIVTKDASTSSKEDEKEDHNSVKSDSTCADEANASTSTDSSPAKKHGNVKNVNNNNNNKSRNSPNKKNQRNKGANANNTNNISNSPNNKKKNHHNNSNTNGTNSGNNSNSPKKNKHKKQTKKKNKNKKNNSNKNKKERYTLTPQDLENLTRGAVGQVEYFFSADELIKNIFIRQQMDVEGYLPAAIVFNFPSILSYGIPYYELLNTIAETSNVVDADLVNECLRMKGGEEDYKKWLFRNTDGTLGCPKWIKEQQEEEEVVATATSDDTENVEKDDDSQDTDVDTEQTQQQEEETETQVDSTAAKNADLVKGDQQPHEDRVIVPELTMTDSDTEFSQ